MSRVLFVTLLYCGSVFLLESPFALDLNRFVPKLIQHDIPQKEIALQAIEEYKRFLYLKSKYPLERLAPSDYVDFVWHNHILDTRAYMRDTMAILGQYLHHKPLFDSDSQQKMGQNYDITILTMMASFNRTMELYEFEFGAGSIPVSIWKRPWENSDVPPTIPNDKPCAGRYLPLLEINGQLEAKYHFGPSKIDGVGLFASQYLRKCNTLGIAWIEFDRKSVAPFAAKINHSQSPNIEFVRSSLDSREYLAVVTKDVFPGQEITANYWDTPSYIRKPNGNWK